MSDGVYSERKNAVANDTKSATTLVRLMRFERTTFRVGV